MEHWTLYRRLRFAFIVRSLWSSDSDLTLESSWIETLGTFILNVENKFLIFPYKKKKITLQDINMKSESKVASSEDFREISKVMSQGNEKSIQTIQKDFNKVITGKEEEIYRQEIIIINYFCKSRRKNIKFNAVKT